MAFIEDVKKEIAELDKKIKQVDQEIKEHKSKRKGLLEYLGLKKKKKKDGKIQTNT